MTLRKSQEHRPGAGRTTRPPVAMIALILIMAVLSQACGQVAPAATATPPPSPTVQAAAPSPTPAAAASSPTAQAAQPSPTAPAAAASPTARVATATPVPPTPAPQATATAVPPSPTAGVTATPALAACPVDPGACAFAAQLNGWIANKDIDAIVAHSAPREWECPGPRPRGMGDPFPLCEGSTAGERRSGFPLHAFQSEGSVLSQPAYRDFLRGWVESAAPSRGDEFGPGAARVHTIGCPQTQAGAAAACREQLVVVVSAIREGRDIAPGTRFHLIFFVQQTGGAAAIQGIGTALASINEPEIIKGGPVAAFPWAPLTRPAPGAFYPVRTNQ